MEFLENNFTADYSYTFPLSADPNITDIFSPKATPQILAEIGVEWEKLSIFNI